MPKFSEPRKNVTITATVDPNGQQVTDWNVRNEVQAALYRAARANGVTVSDIEVTVTDGEREVILFESEYNALVQATSGDTSTTTDGR